MRRVSRRRPGARIGEKVKAAPRPKPIERRVAKFTHEPASVRTAAGVIVAVTAVVVVGSGIVFRLVDSKEYPNIWAGMWLALQTITTVGYGDVNRHRRDHLDFRLPRYARRPCDRGGRVQG